VSVPVTAGYFTHTAGLICWDGATTDAGQGVPPSEPWAYEVSLSWDISHPFYIVVPKGILGTTADTPLDIADCIVPQMPGGVAIVAGPPGPGNATDADVAVIATGPGATKTAIDANINGKISTQHTADNATYLTGFLPEKYGALGDGTTNDTSAVATCYTAAAIYGGKVQFGAKTYLCETINHTSSKVVVAGVSSGAGTISGDHAATKIITPSGHHGMIITGQGGVARDLCFTSAENGTGSSDGVQVRNGEVKLDGVHAEKFGRRGLSIDSSGSINCNLFHVRNCSFDFNGGDGVRISGGTDVNAGTMEDSSFYGNTGYGTYNAGGNNAFLNLHYLANTTGAVYDNALSSRYVCYIETPQTFVLGSNSRDGIYDTRLFGGVLPTGNATALSTWRVGVSTGFMSHLSIHGTYPGSPSTYILRSDVAGETQFTLDYDGTLTSVPYANRNVFTYNRWQDRFYHSTNVQFVGNVGFYNTAPVARAAAITTPTAPSATYVQAEAAAMKTAVDAIRVALTNLGLTL